MGTKTAFHPLLLFLDTKCHQDGYQTVANYLCISVSTLDKYQRGLGHPNATTLARIIHAWPVEAPPLVIDYLQRIYGENPLLRQRTKRGESQTLTAAPHTLLALQSKPESGGQDTT